MTQSVGVPVYPVVATTGAGLDMLRRALANIKDLAPPRRVRIWPELTAAAEALAEGSREPLRFAELERLLIDGATEANQAIVRKLGEEAAARIDEQRRELFGEDPPIAVDARKRYAWVRGVLDLVQKTAPAYVSWRSRITEFLNRPVPGTIGLFVVMAIVFQAVFAWATPVMDVIDAGTSALGSMVFESLGDNAFSSLIADGVIAGVGSVVIFLPQILILFTFIILLEDSGYLARAAYLMDRAMRSVGLSGQSIIPMISSFACAVPGIMATRVIPSRRDRIATILAAPFMTCSARLPVYALLIAAFVPETSVGFLNLQGLVLFGLYLFGIVMGILTALLMRKTALRGPKPPFALMLPEFRRPNLQTVGIQLLGRAKVFLRRAGTVIFAVAVIIWALAYYPRAEQMPAGLDENTAAALQMEQSWLGRAGKVVEPVFAPLGWDWRVSSAVIAGFPAREVVIAVPADLLRLLPAMCGHARDHPARNQYLALAGIRVDVYDRDWLHRRAHRLPARYDLDCAQPLRGFLERRIILGETEAQPLTGKRSLAEHAQRNRCDTDIARPADRKLRVRLVRDVTVIQELEERTARRRKPESRACKQPAEQVALLLVERGQRFAPRWIVGEIVGDAQLHRRAHGKGRELVDLAKLGGQLRRSGAVAQLPARCVHGLAERGNHE